MSESYHDRMIRPPAGVAPSVTFVRERNRLIPIPVGPAVAVPVGVYRPEGPRAHACEPQAPEAQPRNSAEDEGADAPSEGR